ncbi:MAG: DUF302 domain-containing protein [Pseudomonadota bacterium]
MHSIRLLALLVFCFWVAPLAAYEGPADFSVGHMVRYEADSDFESAENALKMAIGDQGLAIATESHVSDMLDRTGRDIGAERKVYVKAVNFEFCSALYSRKLMEANPDNIVFCPFIISVYSIPEEPERTFFAYRRLLAPTADEDTQAVLRSIEEVLDSIARRAVELAF